MIDFNRVIVFLQNSKVNLYNCIEGMLDKISFTLFGFHSSHSKGFFHKGIKLNIVYWMPLNFTY